MNALAPQSLPEAPAVTAAQPELDLPGARGRFERWWRWSLVEELPACASFLPEPERAAFAAACRNLPAPGDASRIESYLLARWRGAEGWTARWIAERAWAMAPRGMSPRVLDAGAGFGTDAMLFAAMGAEVFGVDVDATRLAAAERRARHHATVTGRPLAVRFERADLTSPWTRDYDVVWLHDAWAPLGSQDAFLAELRRKLRPGGIVVVSERLAGAADPSFNGAPEVVAAAGKRPLGPPAPDELRERFAGLGFGVTHHELSWASSSWMPETLHRVLAPLRGPSGWTRGLAERQWFAGGAR